MLKIKDTGLWHTLEQAARNVRRWPKRGCERCGGTGVSRERDYDNDGWDITYKDVKCWGCGGKGTVGGGQPGLHLWFQSTEERDAFKVKLLRMRGIKWTDEAPAVLESQTEPHWKED